MFFPLLGGAQVPPPCEPWMTEISPTFDYACINCGFNGYVGSTAGWDAQPVPSDFCGVNPAPRWLGFIAMSTQMGYIITPQNCTGGKGMQAAIYHNENEPALICSAGCDTCGNEPLVLYATNLSIGSNYYLLLTGYDQDVCDFIISPFPPMIPVVPTVTTPPVLAGPATVCPGGTFDYSIPPVAGAGFYTWESNFPGMLFNGMIPPVDFEGPEAASIQVTIPEGLPNGTQIKVCVTPLNSCNTGTQRCKTLTAQNYPVTTLPKVTVCNEDAPYILPWGEAVPATGTTGLYQHTYTTMTGCDSIVKQLVLVLQPIQSNVSRYICTGASVEVCGSTYSQSGDYQIHCTSYLGCDSLINLHLNVLAPVGDIIGGDTISVCGNSTALLYSPPSPNSPGVSFKSWKNLTTGNVATGDTYNVTQSGTYTLSTTMNAGGAVCMDKDTIFVEFHPNVPLLNAFAGNSNAISCIDSVSVLSGGANSQATHFSWVGPEDFSADTSTVTVGTAGWYYFSAANEMCEEIVPVHVSLNTYPGSIAMGATQIGCNQPAIVSGFPSPSSLILQWTTPDNQTLTGNPITVDVPGVYTVLATNTDNGCTLSKSIEVLVDTVAPAVSVTVNHAINGQQNGAATAIVTGGMPPFSYSWMLHDTIIGTAASMNNLQAGIYTLQVTSSNNCDTIITFEVLDLTSGVSELSGNQRWKVSPNPAAQKFVLQHVGQGPMPAATVRCVDPAGKVVFNSNLSAGQAELSVDCRRFEAGIYTLEIVPLDHSPAERLRVVVIR